MNKFFIVVTSIMGFMTGCSVIALGIVRASDFSISSIDTMTNFVSYFILVLGIVVVSWLIYIIVCYQKQKKKDKEK